MCPPPPVPAGKEMLLIATEYCANPWPKDSQFLCGISFDFTDSVKKFSLAVVRIFLEPHAFTSIVNVTDQLSKEFSENIRAWMTSTRKILCTFLCLITSSTLKVPKFASTSLHLLIFVYLITRLQLTKFTRCYVLKTTIKSLLNSKNWFNPLYGDV